MMSVNASTNIHDLKEYIQEIRVLEQQIFALEGYLTNKDWKIKALEFELSLQKQLYENLKQFKLDNIENFSKC